MNHVIHKTAKVMEWVLFIALVPVFFLIVSPVLPTKDLLTSYAVVTGSMEPSVPVGTLALVSKNAATNLTKDDVIAFPEPGNPERIILHRIVSSATSGSITEYKTKGDNNNSQDQWSVNESHVKGKMIYTIPHLGRLIMFAKTPVGFGAMIGVPGVILMLMQIKTIREGIEEEINRRAHLALQKEIATAE